MGKFFIWYWNEPENSEPRTSNQVRSKSKMDLAQNQIKSIEGKIDKIEQLCESKQARQI